MMIIPLVVGYFYTMVWVNYVGPLETVRDFIAFILIFFATNVIQSFLVDVLIHSKRT